MVEDMLISAEESVMSILLQITFLYLGGRVSREVAIWQRRCSSVQKRESWPTCYK